MSYSYNDPQYKGYRKILRSNLTREEIILWTHLKNKQLGCKFRRQIGLGQYIVDFYCPDKKLVLELDGGHHAEEAKEQYDQARTEYLNSLGLRVLRIWNNEINYNLSGVIEEIKYYLGNPRYPSGSPRELSAGLATSPK